MSATLRRSASPQAQIANFGRGHHDGGSGESAPDGHYNAQAVAPRCARREPNAKCCSNRPRGDLRRARVDDFRMSQHLAALRAVALPAARDGAGRLATSFVMTPAPGTWTQTAIPWRANAAVPALKTCAALSADSDFSSDGRTSAQNVASRHARPSANAVRCCDRRRGDLRCPEVSTFECTFRGARRRGW